MGTWPANRLDPKQHTLQNNVAGIHCGSVFMSHMTFTLLKLSQQAIQSLPLKSVFLQIQMLHCIEQAACDGGASIYVDGFCTSQKLKDVDAKSFKLLSDVPIAFFDIGTDSLGDFDMRCSRPMIE